MSDFLAEMAEASLSRATAARRTQQRLERRASERAPPPPIIVGEFGVIAEIKKRSPAEGVLAGDSEDHIARAELYESAGAAAVSVLTEPRRFDGSLTDLSRVADALGAIPAMRKDFLVDTIQILEARAGGAGGVLLIAALLDDGALVELTGLARELGLFVLLEAFDSADLGRCARLIRRPAFSEAVADGQILLGVNTRDLRTLDVDTGRLQRLAPELPPEAIAVAESGVTTAAEAGHAAAIGYGAILVGTALMRSGEPAALLRSMHTAGAAAARER